MPENQARLFGRAYKTRRARTGLDTTVARLRSSGRLEDVDAAWIALARVSADQLDGACSDPDESRYTRGVLIARHLAVLDRLIERPDTDSADDLESLFAGVRDAQG
jgi:hypothetical protein